MHSTHLHPRNRLLITCMLASCAHGPRPVELLKDTAMVSVQMETIPRGETQEHPILPKEVLHSGDAIAMRVTVDRPTHIYVVQVSPSGTPALLFPTAGDQEVQRGALRIPDPMRRFELGDQVGVENLYVVASTGPIEQTDPALCERLRLGCGTSLPDWPQTLEQNRGLEANRPVAGPAKEPPAPKVALPPDKRGIDLDERSIGLDVEGDRITGVLKKRTNQRGVAVLRFSFRHEP